jgi:Tol biopolymer transport system component
VGRRSAAILTVSDGKLLRSTSDLWGYDELPVPNGLEPLTARWSPGKSQIVFTARTPYDRAAFDPGPAPPAGSTRHVHFVLDDLMPIFDPPTDREEAAEEQVFLLDLASGLVRQLTTPWIEDYMDALRDGEARGNTGPLFSPDGTSIVFTNVSTTSGESALLRLNLVTGEVYNLTNATAGAVPVADFDAAFFPDGSHLAFTTPIGLQNQIMVMDATDGTDVRQLTDDDFFNISPAVSPDGRTLVYVSYRGTELFRLSDGMPADDAGIPLDGWYLVALDLQTGEERLLTRAGDPPAFAPVWIDDGTAVMFLSMGASGQPDIYRVDAAGTSRPRPVQVTLRTGEVSVDWR